MTTGQVPKTQAHWREALASLPAVLPGGKIPSFFFGHGQPMLIWPEALPMPDRELSEFMGPKGPLAMFLRDFGPVLLEKYKPKAIVVFSAHWESSRERIVTDYGDENPLLMDYFGFNPELYEIEFKSRGDSGLSRKIVDLFKVHDIPARTTVKLEHRGRDGRGFAGPGLDHGVFVPFKLMFGDRIDIPIIQISIDGDLAPESNWEIGKALDDLRSEGVLILSGGLTIHTFQDFSAFSEDTAKPIFKSFDTAIIDAVRAPAPEVRRKALLDLTSHPGFRKAHPREEHFIPLYIAAGCGAEGEARVINAIHSSPTFAFGL